MDNYSGGTVYGLIKRFIESHMDEKIDYRLEGELGELVEKCRDILNKRR